MLLFAGTQDKKESRAFLVIMMVMLSCISAVFLGLKPDIALVLSSQVKTLENSTSRKSTTTPKRIQSLAQIVFSPLTIAAPTLAQQLSFHYAL